jgi:type II secretory pathway predicted ATPase ExeA
MTSTQLAGISTVTQHFNARYSPFTDTFAMGETFFTKSDAYIMGHMTLMLGQGKSFSLTGEPGSGKSMLLKILMGRMDQKSFRFAYIPYSGLKQTSILRELCEKMAIDIAGRGSLLNRLHKAFCGKGDNPYPVIILDEAHAIPGDALLELFSLTQDMASGKATASIILCGHPFLEKTLSLDIHAAIKTRLARHLRMPPLKEDEVDAFIKARLKVAGAPTDLFSKDAIALIETDSKGNRRMVMNIAGNCLDLAVMREEKLITDGIAREIGEDRRQ